MSWRLGRLPCRLPGVETFHCITFSTAQKLLTCKVLQLPGIGWSDAWWSNQCVIITITITKTITIMIMIATNRRPAKCSCQVITSQRVILVHREVSLWNCASCMQEPVTSIQFCSFSILLVWWYFNTIYRTNSITRNNKTGLSPHVLVDWLFVFRIKLMWICVGIEG